MKGLLRILILLVVLIIVAGVAGLAMMDMPAPTQHVEKVIPNDRLGPLRAAPKGVLRGLTGFGLAAALGLAALALSSAAQAQSQPDAAPISLLPQASDKAVAPRTRRRRLGSGNHAADRQSGPDSNAAKPRPQRFRQPWTKNHGGLPISIWANTDRALAVKLISTVGPSASRTLQNLVRRLLLSVSTPPAVADGAKPDDAFLVGARRALWGLGDMDDLATFLQTLPAAIDHPAVAPVAGRYGIAGWRHRNRPAPEAAPLGQCQCDRSLSVELRVYCQFTNGQAARLRWVSRCCATRASTIRIFSPWPMH